MENIWSGVDSYFFEILNKPDPLWAKILQRNAEAGLPPYDVSPNQGKLLQLFVQITKTESILEIGTLGAYSSIWMAQALPKNGRLISLEYEAHHAKVARENIKLSGQESKIEVRVGEALNILPQLADEKKIFDLVFIDADKTNNRQYFEWALRLTHPGSLIIVDNVVRNGTVLDSKSTDPSVTGVHHLNNFLKNNSKVSATAVQTVGSKGYDGFIVARVNG